MSVCHACGGQGVTGEDWCEDPQPDPRDARIAELEAALGEAADYQDGLLPGPDEKLGYEWEIQLERGEVKERLALVKKWRALLKGDGR